jgi:dihydrofolate reductase
MEHLASKVSKFVLFFDNLKDGMPWHIPADFKFFRQITTSYKSPGKE